VKRYNTIIFVPHARARFRQLTVSTRVLALCAGGVLSVAISAIGFGWAYLSSARADRQYRAAMAENERLRSASAALHRRLDGLSKQLSDVESRTRRLAIVAGLAETIRTGVGGPSGSGIPPRLAVDDFSARLAAGDAAALSSKVALLEAQFSRRTELIATTPTVWPVHGVIHSGFGIRTDPFTGQPAYHEGVDISTPRSEPVLATADGVVERSGWAGEYGKAIEIVHGDRYETLYGHLEATLVREGQRVRRGDRVGLVGSTGRSTAPHLHYEVHVDGRAVDPLEYILER
jgi:murein DD-endopeptidase MepM/ murein hydrolase activator NlpD